MSKRLNIQPVNTKLLFDDQVLRLSGNLNLAVSFKARKTIIKHLQRLIVYHLSIVADRALKRTAKFNQSPGDKNYRLFLR